MVNRKTTIERVREENYQPLNYLNSGNWFKLICGASYQHLPAVRSLALAYTLAGADCIDVAAEQAVIAAAQEGLQVAHSLKEEATALGFKVSKPWLMVSVNDGEDPHFRKAFFDSTQCPNDCSRPCEQICPASAIAFSGVILEKCYGCGRCLPVCPQDLILTQSHVSKKEAIAFLIQQTGVNALEIHTKPDHLTHFHEIWKVIKPQIHKMELLAISCPDAPNLMDYLQSIYNLITPLPCALIWQTDGRPMSGDIGVGATRASVKLAEKVLAAKLPGYVQLAGGTNQHTVSKLKAQGLLQEKGDKTQYVAGVAYGSYARALVAPFLEKLEKMNDNKLENHPDLLWETVKTAHLLVSQIKRIH